MDSITKFICGVCDAQHLTKNADYWCFECDEGLCSVCSIHHGASKYTRTHEAISIESYKLLPPSITNIVQHCPEHDRKYQIYCPHHECLCCPICLTTGHKKCVDLLVIEELSKNSKTSTLFQIMEQSLKDIKNNIGKVVEDRNLNLQRINEQRRMFQEQIQEMRKKINSHLDSIEKQMLKDLNATEEKIKSQIENFLTQITIKDKAINDLQSTMSAAKQHASDIQTFLCTKYLQNAVENEEKFIQNLSDDKGICQIDMKCRFDDTIKKFMSTVSVFGFISVETGASYITLSKESEKQAQLTTTPQAALVQSNSDIKLQLRRKWNIPKKQANRLSGCTVHPSGSIIIADCDYNKRIVILSQTDEAIEKEIPFSSMPFDVKCIDDKRIAVTTLAPNKIQIINIDTCTVDKVIPMSNICYGITYRDRKLVYYEQGMGIQSMDYNTNTITNIVKQNNLARWNFVALSEDRIYKTDYNANTVTCYGMSGEKIWEFRDETVLKSPWGIALDKGSNVYVASIGTKGIVVISADGKCGPKLVGQIDEVKDPRGVCLSTDGKILVVVTAEGNVYLYSVL